MSKIIVSLDEIKNIVKSFKDNDENTMNSDRLEAYELGFSNGDVLRVVR
jgi:hypothetical protein